MGIHPFDEPLIHRWRISPSDLPAIASRLSNRVISKHLITNHFSLQLRYRPTATIISIHRRSRYPCFKRIKKSSIPFIPCDLPLSIVEGTIHILNKSKKTSGDLKSIERGDNPSNGIQSIAASLKDRPIASSPSNS